MEFPAAEASELFSSSFLSFDSKNGFCGAAAEVVVTATTTVDDAGMLFCAAVSVELDASLSVLFSKLKTDGRRTAAFDSFDVEEFTCCSADGLSIPDRIGLGLEP